MITWIARFFHSPSSYLLEIIIEINDYVIMFLFRILLIVLINMTYRFVAPNYNKTFYENHELEFIWTVFPFLILAFILGPSIKCLYMIDSCLYCGMTVIATGHQWYWSYSYGDLEDWTFDSYINRRKDIPLRLVEVDNSLILPSLTPIRMIVSSADVIHSWTVPSLGVKSDAIPGRINQLCFLPKRSGVFIGQCSEICGINHRFIPIQVEVINFKKFSSLNFYF